MISRRNIHPLIITIFFAFVSFFALAQPELSRKAIQQSVTLCLDQLLVALFPFLVLSNLLFVCNTHQYLGRLFSLPAKWAGVSKSCAGSAVLMGFVGGFAPAAVTIGNLYKTKFLTAQECSALLSLCLCTGPSFTVLTIGTFWGNLQIGWILFLAQLIACILCSIVQRFFFPIAKSASAEPLAESEPAKVTSFSAALENATLAYLKLCGCIIFFGFLSAGLAAYLPSPFDTLSLLFMEVSTGCLHASHIAPYGLYISACIISTLGVSALIQIRALLPKEISLKPYFLLRPLHMGISVMLVKVFTLYLPETPTYNSLAPTILLRERTSFLPALFLFIILCRLAALLSTLSNWKSKHSVL